MKKNFIIFRLVLGFAAAVTMAWSAVEQTEPASIIAKCTEAMGGAARIKAVRTLRLEVVYPDHGASAVLHEIRRPNLIRTERAGDYVAVFDGPESLVLSTAAAAKFFGPADPLGKTLSTFRLDRPRPGPGKSGSGRWSGRGGASWSSSFCPTPSS